MITRTGCNTQKCTSPEVGQLTISPLSRFFVEVDDNSGLSQSACPSSRHENTGSTLSRRAPETMVHAGLWALPGLLFTGWSGHSGVWACRAAPHGLAGKTPPAESSQWTVCDHHPGCSASPLHHPPTVSYTHTHATQTTRQLSWMTEADAFFGMNGKPKLKITTVECTHGQDLKVFDSLHVAQWQYKCFGVALAVPQQKDSENKREALYCRPKPSHF